jgi:FixJ family two-component response regulator
LIAVVDDDPSMLESIGRLLEALGFEIKLFSSAEAYKAQLGATGAACLILDINLPGMSGIDLQRELSSSGIAVPVIFITGNDSEVTMRSVAEAGCVACLPKPFGAPALLEAVNKAIGGAR